MFEKLIPWKKRHGQLAVHRGEPTRQSEGENHPLIALRQQFDALMNRFLDDQWFGKGMFRDLSGVWNQPQLNWDLGWEDKGNEYIFRAELPGFEPEDFQVKVSGNLMTVHAEHREEKSRGNGRGYRYGSFRRTCTLPHGADDTKIDARYHSGVLEILLPKTEAAQSKRIEVKSA